MYSACRRPRLQPGTDRRWSCRATGNTGTMPRKRAIRARQSLPGSAPLSVTYGMGVDGARPGGADHHAGVSRIFTCVTLLHAQRPATELTPPRLTAWHWEDAFRAYLTELDERKPVVALRGPQRGARGDRPQKPRVPTAATPGFTDEERGKFTAPAGRGVYRYLPLLLPGADRARTAGGRYMFHAREKNAGWRIDYWIVSQRPGRPAAGPRPFTRKSSAPTIARWS